MTPKKQANLRRSVAIKGMLVYLVVAFLVLFVSSLIGFYLGGLGCLDFSGLRTLVRFSGV